MAESTSPRKAVLEKRFSLCRYVGRNLAYNPATLEVNGSSVAGFFLSYQLESTKTTQTEAPKRAGREIQTDGGTT